MYANCMTFTTAIRLGGRCKKACARNCCACGRTRKGIRSWAMALPSRCCARLWGTHAARMTALMPGPQGVMHWPAGLPNRSVLCEETRWPVANVSVDRLILFHGLDTSEHPAAVLEECYRVLSDSGRAIVIVPNRASLWARKDGTPFAVSRPYTATELERRLKRHGFTPHTHVTALYQPPFSTRFWRKMGPVWETIGRSIPAWKGGGVLMVEVSKQVPRPARPGLGQIISKPVAVWDGLAKPARV